MYLRIERNPKYYIYISIVPALLTYVLSPSVFLIPIESGEKVSSSVTLFLAQIVTLTGLTNMIPPSSATFPKCGFFSAVSVFHMGLQTLTAVIGYYKSSVISQEIVYYETVHQTKRNTQNYFTLQKRDNCNQDTKKLSLSPSIIMSLRNQILSKVVKVND